jgi:hypothetical protein
MIEPNALCQDEQDWLRTEQDQQNWLRAEQDQRTASEPSRRSPYTAAIGESASTRAACITEMLEELCTQKVRRYGEREYDLEEHRLVSALAMRCKPFKLFDSLRERCLTTAARKPSILVEQATSSYSFRSPELSQPI